MYYLYEFVFVIACKASGLELESATPFRVHQLHH